MKRSTMPCAASQPPPIATYRPTAKRGTVPYGRGPAGVVVAEAILTALAGACLILALGGCKTGQPASDPPPSRSWPNEDPFHHGGLQR